MKNVFSDKSILVVNAGESISETLIPVLKVVGFETIHISESVEAAHKMFQENNHNVIAGEVVDSKHDIIAFCQQVRGNLNAPNPQVPMLAIADREGVQFLDQIRMAKMTDMLQKPYALDDLSAKLKFILKEDGGDLEAAQDDYIHGAGDAHLEQWPDGNEAASLTNTLLDHYLKHHEIVFAKLKVAQDATHRCIEEVRETYKKVREKDNTNVLGFKDFDKMWEDVLGLFVKGGLSETDLREVEKLVSVIPKDIRSKYDIISQQDKSFLTLVESLNVAAYKKAKDKVMTLQALPNPLNGRTSEDYAHMHEKRGEHAEAFMFKPKMRGDDG